MISGLNSTGHEIGGSRDRDLLHDRGRKWRHRQPAGRLGIRAPSSRPGSSRVSPASSLWPSCRARTPLRAEAAAEPQRDAEPLEMAEPTTPAEARPEAPPGRRRTQRRRHPRRRPRSAGAQSVAACRRSLAAPASSEPRSTSTSRPEEVAARRCHGIRRRRAGRRGDERRRAHRGGPLERSSECSVPPGGNSRSSTVCWNSTLPGSLPRNSAAVTSPCSTSSSPDRARPETGRLPAISPVACTLPWSRAIVHTASREIQGGRIGIEAENAMISTALAAIGEQKA